MSLSENSPLVLELGDLNDFPVASGASPIYEGSALSLTSDGYARGLTAGDTLFAGHAEEAVDNSAGASGAKTVRAKTGTYRAEVTLTGVAQTNVGDLVYMSDDGTYTLSSGGSAVKVGIVVRYVSTNTCVVEFYAYANTVL